MTYTYKHITMDGTETTTYTVDENNKVVEDESNAS